MPNDTPPGSALSIDQRSQILQFVEDINAERPDRHAAQEKLRQLQTAIPSATFDVVSEVENIGGDVTYALLMTHGPSVYSIACARRDVLPWQLRGATNAEANELLTVNGHRVTVEHAVHLLDVIWESGDLSTRMIEMALLAPELEKQGVALSERESADLLQSVYDDRDLHSLEARTAWLNRKGLTETRLSRLLEDVMHRRMVERALVDAQYDAEIRDRAHEYVAVHVMQAALPPDCVADAERLLEKDGPGRHISDIVGDLAVARAFQVPFRIEYVELIRYELASLPADVFGQSPGAVQLARVAPDDARLIEILGCETEVSDAILERRVVRRLMNQWYRDQRRAAKIEWHWGRSAREPSPAT